MNQENSTIENTPSEVILRRNQAYINGYKQAEDCVALVQFPHYAQDVIAFVHGFISGTYDRVVANSGDYLSF